MNQHDERIAAGGQRRLQPLDKRDDQKHEQHDDRDPQQSERASPRTPPQVANTVVPREWPKRQHGRKTSYDERFDALRDAKISNRRKQREQRADGDISRGWHHRNLAINNGFLRSLRFLLFNEVAASGRAVLLTFSLRAPRRFELCQAALRVVFKVGVILLPTTVKKTSTGKLGTGTSDQKNTIVAHIFLSHIFLSTFGCGMTAP